MKKQTFIVWKQYQGLNKGYEVDKKKDDDETTKKEEKDDDKQLKNRIN